MAAGKGELTPSSCKTRGLPEAGKVCDEREGRKERKSN